MHNQPLLHNFAFYTPDLQHLNKSAFLHVLQPVEVLLECIYGDHAQIRILRHIICIFPAVVMANITASTTASTTEDSSKILT